LSAFIQPLFERASSQSRKRNKLIIDKVMVVAEKIFLQLFLQDRCKGVNKVFGAERLYNIQIGFVVVTLLDVVHFHRAAVHDNAQVPELGVLPDFFEAFVPVLQGIFRSRKRISGCVTDSRSISSAPFFTWISAFEGSTLRRMLLNKMA
jgi:hypothetical protein